MSYRFIARGIIPLFSLIVATILHHFLTNLTLLQNVKEILILAAIVIFCLAMHQTLLNILEKNVKVECSTILLNTEQKKKQEARRGLVVFLSLYALTMEGKDKWKIRYGYHPDDDKKRFKDDVAMLNGKKDYKGLFLDNPSFTNFGTTTRAILTHIPQLDSLWIISTESKNNPMAGSQTFIDTYESYLQNEVNKEKEIYINTYNTISVDEDSKIVEETQYKLAQIYKMAKKRKIGQKEIIVDVTPGTVSMTTGAVLGSIGRERDIQLLVAGYEPGHGLVRMKDTLIIKYQTILPREAE